MLHERIGPYQILDVLGRGGMGVVYVAERDDGTEAAVKTVRVANESTLESIRREIQTLRELKHPGVVAIRDHGVTEGVPWYAMELLHGSTLRDHLRSWFPESPSTDDATRELLRVDSTTRDLLKPARKAAEVAAQAANPDAPPYSLAHIATIFRNICEPLAYVHGQGVVHRDLSPVNVFLVGAERPVLFDFGLAAQFRVGSAREVLEIGGVLRGTAHYMAPEQARGEVVDARADIYALGCMLYEALTGRPPFLGNSPLDVVLQHIDAPPIPPRVMVPALPLAFEELVLRLLAKQPRDRLGYAQDVGAALERLGAKGTSSPDLTPPRSYTYRPSLAGRTDEIQALDALMRKLADGTGGCAVLIGESGVGKTRLAAEIATLAGGHGIRVITCECEPIGTTADELHGSPLHPLRPVLRAFADLCRDGVRSAIDVLGPSVSVLAAYEPALAGLAPPLTEHIDPVAMRFRVLAVLRDVLVEVARAGRLLVVLDDLHLADDLTLAFLQSLRGFLADAGIFVLATARVDELTSEITTTLDALSASWFEVPRLERRAIGAIVRDMLALEDDAPTLTEFVTARSEGNPLFAAEYVRTAVDEGLLHRDIHGRWRVGTRDDETYDRLPTPGSVRELVVRRLESLSPTARGMASAAATLGRTSSPELLAEVADMTGEIARAAINELIHRHVLEELPDTHLRFVHDKLREHAYAEMAELHRRRFHQRAAAVLEVHYRGDALHLEQLAHHHEHAGQLALAANYLEKAAEHALATAAFGEARTLLRHLIQIAPDATPERRARWNRLLGEACFALGDLGGSAAHLAQSLDGLGQTVPSNKLRWSARIAGGIARQMWSRTIGRRRTHAADPKLVDAALASARMSSLYFFNDDSLGLVGSALTAANLAETAGSDVPIAEIYSQLGYIAGLGRLHGVAAAYFAKARDIAESTRDPIGLARAVHSEAAFHVGTGAWQLARTAAEQGLSIATSVRNPQEVEVAYTILGHVEFSTGQFEASRRSAVMLYESAQARANLQHETWGVYTQARAALYLGELDDAVRDFERAMAMLAGQSDHASHILCGGMMASAFARRGDAARAKAAADDTTKRIGSRLPPVFTIAEGFIGAADAYLELWRQGDKSVASAAKTAVDNLARLARIFPIASPAAHNLAGVYLLRRGARRRAVASLRRGLKTAERLAMPYDQAIAHAGLAEAGEASHRVLARELFSQLGCRWHLDVS
ncbi:MAG: protein kinase [Kofleriaceae bacterium]|nr:protein kinase [Kofleriaceae bacterium]